MKEKCKNKYDEKRRENQIADVNVKLKNFHNHAQTLTSHMRNATTTITTKVAIKIKLYAFKMYIGCV